MKNPYLKPQSHRARVLAALFALIVVKVAAAFLDFYSVPDIPTLFAPGNLIALGAITVAFLFDLLAIYHLTTRWHRLDRHAWIILPSAVLNLALALLLTVPFLFAYAQSALTFVLLDSSWVYWATWIAVAVAIALALFQVFASFQLIRRLHQPLAASF